MGTINEKALAKAGALHMILELRGQIEAIQKAYPEVIMAERVHKMKQTVAAKAEGAAAPAKAATGKKKSHHKKKVATSLGEAVAQAAAETPAVEPVADEVPAEAVSQ